MKVHLIILLVAAVWTLIQMVLFTYLAQRKDKKAIDKAIIELQTVSILMEKQ